jgi:hypothetical protein
MSNNQDTKEPNTDDVAIPVPTGLLIDSKTIKPELLPPDAIADLNTPKKHGGKRPGAGRPTNLQRMADRQFVADWFTANKQREKWQQLLRSRDEEIILRTMIYLTDRLFGKAPQGVELSGSDGEPFKVIIEHIAGRLPQADDDPSEQ